MKKIALILLLLGCESVYGQSAFIPVSVAFPHIAVGGDPGGINYVTLLQFVNNNSAATTGHISLFGDSGAPLAVPIDGQGPLSTLDVNLAPGQTRQIQMTLNGAVTGGWVGISYTPSEALTTVILQFRSGSTLLSEIGVDPALSTMDSTDFAAETDSTLNTGLAIANPDSVAASILASLWDPGTGAVIARNTISVPPHGHLARFMTDLFPSAANITQIRAKVSLDQCFDASCASPGGNGFFATAVRFTGDQFTTIPVSQRTPDGDQVRMLPQVAFGGPSDGVNMKTILYFTTDIQSGVFGTADIFDNDGNPLAASVDGSSPTSSFTFTVPGNRVTRVVLSGDSTLRSGWVRLTLPDKLYLISNAVFQSFAGPNLVSEASVLESPEVTRGLIYVESQKGTENIGVAFANPQPTDNPIHLNLFDNNGTLFAQQDVTLPPYGHLARFVTELFPDLGSLDAFHGSLSLSSGATFSAIALRATADKIATLPIASDGQYRPAIATVRVTSVQRSNGQVNFQLDVSDVDSNIATSASPSVSGYAYLDFGSTGYDEGVVTIDGTPLLNKRSGTLIGSFKPPNITGTVPSGTQAVFYIYITDATGNLSNFVSIPVRF